MKIALISDTHGWLDPTLHKWFAGVEMILHAGDLGSEEILACLEELAPTLAVRGNIDMPDPALPLERVVEVGDMRIAMLHIAGTPRKPRPEALELIARARPDILLVGHSHIPVIERREGVLWVNPGAAGRHGFHAVRTAALLHLDATRHIDLITLGPRSDRVQG
jgi:putative phosphoesterase